ncbi:MAG: ATP-binding protein, partial [Bacilli bacterium]|nr:ATP-binding protein [Bacilli bacterium]
MDNDLTAFFKKNNLKLNNKSIVIAISTGVDSMVLLTQFLEIKDIYNLNIICAHVNHMKREQSIIEEKYIIDFC